MGAVGGWVVGGGGTCPKNSPRRRLKASSSSLQSPVINPKFHDGADGIMVCRSRVCAACCTMSPTLLGPAAMTMTDMTSWQASARTSRPLTADTILPEIMTPLI